jgi:hypothetical protein
MSSNSPFNFGDPSAIRVDRQDPYSRLQQVTIYVGDLDRSRKFYLDQLGFSLAYAARYQHPARMHLNATF